MSDLKQALIDALLETPVSKIASNRSEVVVRCCFCGDSQNENHSHMYISLNTDYIMYDCKRCPAHGILSPTVLQRIGIHDMGIMEWVRKQMPISTRKKVLTDDGRQEEMINTKFGIPVLAKDRSKVDYLSKRTGVDFHTPENREKYKIVTNLAQFIKENDLRISPKFADMVDPMTKSYIGFMSYDKRSIQFRNTTDTGARYVLFSLAEKRDAFFYTPNIPFDPLAPEPRFAITEGPIGNIVVRERFYPEDATNVVVGAGTSFGTMRQAFEKLYYLTCYFGAVVDVYSDPEIQLERYREEVFKPYMQMSKFRIFYNQANGGSDFNDIQLGIEPKQFQL